MDVHRLTPEPLDHDLHLGDPAQALAEAALSAVVVVARDAVALGTAEAPAAVHVPARDFSLGEGNRPVLSCHLHLLVGDNILLFFVDACTAQGREVGRNKPARHCSELRLGHLHGAGLEDHQQLLVGHSTGQNSEQKLLENSGDKKVVEQSGHVEPRLGCENIIRFFVDLCTRRVEGRNISPVPTLGLTQGVHFLPGRLDARTGHPGTNERLHPPLGVAEHVQGGVQHGLLGEPPLADAPLAGTLVTLISPVQPVPTTRSRTQISEARGLDHLDLARAGSAKISGDSGSRADGAGHGSFPLGVGENIILFFVDACTLFMVSDGDSMLCNSLSFEIR